MTRPDNETMQLLQQAKQLDQQGKESDCIAMATKIEIIGASPNEVSEFRCWPAWQTPSRRAGRRRSAT